MVGKLSKGAYQSKDIQPLSRAYYNAYCPDTWRKEDLGTRTERDSRISHTAEEEWQEVINAVHRFGSYKELVKENELLILGILNSKLLSPSNIIASAKTDKTFFRICIFFNKK